MQDLCFECVDKASLRFKLICGPEDATSKIIFCHTNPAQKYIFAKYPFILQESTF